MTDKDSLLSFIARHHTQGLEDVATDALSFILTRSKSARGALSEFLGDDGGPLPIAKAKTQAFLEESFAYPDMALEDSDGNLAAYIESKFWAPLTHNQPVTYWEALPKDRRTVLLFIAPKIRVDEEYLWNELVSRLQEAEHHLGPAVRSEAGVYAESTDLPRRLMLTSWDFLLRQIEQRVKQDGDAQAGFEIAELQALATAATEGDRPDRDEYLKQLIADAVKGIVQTGWANTDGLGVGAWIGFYGRNLRFAGAFSWLGIVDAAKKHMPAPTLWLTINSNDSGFLSRDVARARLGDTAESREEWHGWMDLCVPIPLLAGADRSATVEAIVSELENIARLIDPDGPTYR